MIIKSINLRNFRNHTKANFKFNSGVNVIVGENATGKTNILEAIYLLSSGKSFRAKKIDEMVEYFADVASARVDISLSKHDKIKLEAILTRGEITVGNKKVRAQKKKLLVNGIAKRMVDFAGNLKVVLFSPQDLEIVTDSPSIRRDFLNDVLSLVDREYRRCLYSYEKGIRQRNRLLARIREGEANRNQLLFWNKLLIKNGGYLTIKREEFIDFVNSTDVAINDSVYSVEYDKSIISEPRLERYSKEEIAAATTLVGPHRDDLVIRVSEQGKRAGARELDKYGSRGEQRMGVLWLKLAQLTFTEKVTKSKPVLLLDDIFSELDHDHREVVIKAVAKADQSIITTADPHFVENLVPSGIIKI